MFSVSVSCVASEAAQPWDEYDFPLRTAALFDGASAPQFAESSGLLSAVPASPPGVRSAARRGRVLQLPVPPSARAPRASPLV